MLQYEDRTKIEGTAVQSLKDNFLVIDMSDKYSGSTLKKGMSEGIT